MNAVPLPSMSINHIIVLVLSPVSTVPSFSGVGSGVGSTVISGVGLTVGFGVAVAPGSTVGVGVTTTPGVTDGSTVGDTVGAAVGVIVGAVVGGKYRKRGVFRKSFQNPGNTP